MHLNEESLNQYHKNKHHSVNYSPASSVSSITALSSSLCFCFSSLRFVFLIICFAVFLVTQVSYPCLFVNKNNVFYIPLSYSVPSIFILNLIVKFKFPSPPPRHSKCVNNNRRSIFAFATFVNWTIFIIITVILHITISSLLILCFMRCSLCSPVTLTRFPSLLRFIALCYTFHTLPELIISDFIYLLQKSRHQCNLKTEHFLNNWSNFILFFFPLRIHWKYS